MLVFSVLLEPVMKAIALSYSTFKRTVIQSRLLADVRTLLVLVSDLLCLGDLICGGTILQDWKHFYFTLNF